MVDKIQPYNLPLWLFCDKILKQTLLHYEASTKRLSKKMELSNKPRLDQTGNHYKIVTTMLIHT